jgi:hypothetical protein
MNSFDKIAPVVQDLSEQVPLRVAYKTDSKLMAVLGFLVAPFNPFFQTKFVTTWGDTVYFPDRKFVKTFPTASLAVLTHEFVHRWDEKNEGSLKYKLAYAFPQVTGLLTLLAYAVFVSCLPVVLMLAGYLLSCAISKKNQTSGVVTLAACFLGSAVLSWVLCGLLGPLAYVAALLPLAPFPSKGRTRLELRGYSMTVASYKWLYGEPIPENILAQLGTYFTGPAYFFMSWSPSFVKASLEKASEDTLSGEILKTEPFAVVHSILKKHGLVVD